MHPKKRGASPDVVLVATSAKSIKLNSTQLNEAQVITSATTSTTATSVIIATAPAAATTAPTPAPAPGNVETSATLASYSKYFCCKYSYLDHFKSPFCRLYYCTTFIGGKYPFGYLLENWSCVENFQ